MSIAERVRARVLKATAGEVLHNQAQPEQVPVAPPEPEAPAETVTLVARVAARFSKAIQPTM